MAFSGIHFNYSFSEELLKADFALTGQEDFQKYKNNFYVDLAQKALEYNWLIVAITAASPLLDSSYFEKKTYGNDVFNGMGSTRCSESGYWNFFTPILDYTDIDAYAESIMKYIKSGLIQSSSELYFPIRLKPPGKYRLSNLQKLGVSHIELRMIDLNPLAEAGIDERDVRFIQLLLVYLASTDAPQIDLNGQILAIQNTRNAARYDLKTVSILKSDGTSMTVVKAAKDVIGRMREFYDSFPKKVTDAIDYQMEKFEDGEKRYSWQIRKKFRDGFVEKGVQYMV